MTISDLVNSAKIITDREGNKKALLDFGAWEEIIAALEHWDALKVEINSDAKENNSWTGPEIPPQNQQALALLQGWGPNRVTKMTLGGTSSSKT